MQSAMGDITLLRIGVDVCINDTKLRFCAFIDDHFYSAQADTVGTKGVPQGVQVSVCLKIKTREYINHVSLTKRRPLCRLAPASPTSIRSCLSG